MNDARCAAALGVIAMVHVVSTGAAEAAKRPTVRRIASCPDGTPGFVTVNGDRYYNRPLYGSPRPGFVAAGDLPMPALVRVSFRPRQMQRGGTLALGVIVGKQARWLHAFDHVVTTYATGMLHYELTDPIVPGTTITLDLVPLVRGDGYLVRVDASKPVELIWAFGGLRTITAQDKDRLQGHHRVGPMLVPDELAGTQARIEADHGVVETADPARAVYVRASADVGWRRVSLKGKASATTLWRSQGPEGKVLMGRAPVRSGQPIVLAVAMPPGAKPDQGRTVRDLGDLAVQVDRCRQYLKQITGRIQVDTPDPLVNASLPALAMTMDGLWSKPQLLHGPIRWGFPGLLGWRHAYGHSCFGWHDRMRAFLTYWAGRQDKAPPTTQPMPDSRCGLTRQVGSRYVRGSRGALGGHMYDFTQVWLDFCWYHLHWSGDVAFARTMLPVVRDALAFEKRAFDPDGDGLYESYANTWISDNHWYSGGGCAQASAYVYRGHVLGAELARLAGADPTPYETEARHIRQAMNTILRVPADGIYAEYKDALGLKRQHTAVELASIYHPIDFDVPDALLAYQMLDWTEHHLKNRRWTEQKRVPFWGSSYATGSYYEVASPRPARGVYSSDWWPAVGTTQVLAPGEMMNLAQCYFRLGMARQGYELVTNVLAGMLRWPTPGGIPIMWSPGGGCTDVDHCDGIGTSIRALVEGLFGLYPRVDEGRLVVQPALPPQWDRASIRTPDFGYRFGRTGRTDTWTLTSTRPLRKTLRLVARADGVNAVRGDGVTGHRFEPGVGHAWLVVETEPGTSWTVRVEWADAPLPRVDCPATVAVGERLTMAVQAPAKLTRVVDPQGAVDRVKVGACKATAAVKGPARHAIVFAEVRGKHVAFTHPVHLDIRDPVAIASATLNKTGTRVALTVRNNRTDAMSGTARVSVAGAGWDQAITLKPGAEQTVQATVPPEAWLVPGRNPVGLRVGKDEARATLVAWDLYARRPKRQAGVRYVPVELGKQFNDELANIFNHKYLSPRPNTCSLQVATDGYHMWCNAWGRQIGFPIDTSVLRRHAADGRGTWTTPVGVPFRTPPAGPNVVFVSRWDNFPTEVAVPINRRARHLYLLIAGSTTPMESHIANGQVVVHLAKGGPCKLDLVNPTNYTTLKDPPGLYQPVPRPAPSVALGKDVYGQIVDLDLPADATVTDVVFRCLSKEIVIGLVGLTVAVPVVHEGAR